MACSAFETPILLDRPPQIEVRDGLVYVTDNINGTRICRCFRPGTFARLVREGSETIAKWRVDQLDRVAEMPRR